MVDEGGGAPNQRNAFDPVMIRADFTAAGRRGQALRGFATVVSPQRRRVQVIVTGPKELARAALDLRPGKVARLPLSIRPSAPGFRILRIAVKEKGVVLASAQCTVTIDGQPRPRSRRRFSGKMPEEPYQGTWTEIGAQMARNRRRIGGPTSVEYTVEEIAAPANDLVFYRQPLPFYAQLVEGMAQVAGTAPERLGLVKRGQRTSLSPAWTLPATGATGRLMPFPKSGTARILQGWAMCASVPPPAMRSTSRCTMGQCGRADGLRRNVERRRGHRPHRAPRARALEALRRAHPPGGRQHLDGARDVPGRAGGAGPDPEPLGAVGIDRQHAAPGSGRTGRPGRVGRPQPSDLPPLGPRPGLFCRRQLSACAGGRSLPNRRARGQAANTMLRERCLREGVARRQGRLGLDEVFTLMQSHEAGGMCQHHQGNPGQLYTVCSSVAVARTGELWLAPGPPCQVQYTRYRLFP
jgi:hypothetical protein